MRPARSVALALLVLSLLFSLPALGTPPEGDADGWYKWLVDGDLTTGSSCCYQQACDLDGGHRIVMSSHPCGPSSGPSTLYVRRENGQPTQIRVFDSNCDVSENESVTDMGRLSKDESVIMLLEIVKGRDIGMEVREDALFWLAQSNSDTAFEYLDRLLSDS